MNLRWALLVALVDGVLVGVGVAQALGALLTALAARGGSGSWNVGDLAFGASACLGAAAALLTFFVAYRPEDD